MQVVPAHGHRIKHVLGQDIAIGDDSGDIRMQVVQRLHEFGGAGFEIDDGQPELQSRRLDRAGRELAAATGRRIGAGNDATTSKRGSAAKALSEGTATSGVPANTSLSMVLLEMSMLTARPECSRHWR